MEPQLNAVQETPPVADTQQGVPPADADATSSPLAGFPTPSGNQSEERDPEAPYGRKPDGTPRGKPGRKPASWAGDDPAKRERLASVTQAAPRAPSEPALSVGHHTQVARLVDYKGMGKACAALFVGTGCMILGEDFKPESRDEFNGVAESFAVWCEAEEITKISPSVALCVTLLGYTAGKLEKPTVKTKAQLFLSWLKAKTARTFSRRG
jgi:hypothetical protein